MKTRDPSRRGGTRPREAAPEGVEVSLLFCDVVRSTELTRRLGDLGAYRVIQEFHALVLRAATHVHGQELELRGDGVLLAFESPSHAVDCAVEIQTGLLDSPQNQRVSARIGIHAGPALRVSEGYFGSNVILAARVAEEAAPGEILLSAAVVQRLAERELPVDPGRWVSLKGIPEASLVFPLPWRPKGAKLAGPGRVSPAAEAMRLTLDRVGETLRNEGERSCMLHQRAVV